MLPTGYDIMGVRGGYHIERVRELVKKFKTWSKERLPGNQVSQSKYDRIGIIICRWLSLAQHDIRASSTFDYILPLLVSLPINI